MESISSYQRYNITTTFLQKESISSYQRLVIKLTFSKVDHTSNPMKGLATFGSSTQNLKESAVAFRKMNVRLKKEIISMGDMSIKPHEFTGNHIEPKQFKKWLDEGKEVTILDTRNDYEIKMGTFEGAVDFDIRTFVLYSCQRGCF